jgi:dolichol kinase
MAWMRGALLSPAQEVFLQAALAFALVVAFQVAVAGLRVGQEARRRWQHAVTGHAFVLASYVLPLEVCVPCLVLGAVGILYLRFFRTDLFLETFGPLLRAHEKLGQQLPGAFYFVVGTALAAALFPLGTARYAVECLSIADPVAAWAGQSATARGVNVRIRGSSATLAGSVACFVTAWVIGCLYLANDKDHDDPSRTHWKIIAGAAACCVSEAAPFGNDNLLIPLATGAAVRLASSKWQAFGTDG